MSNEQWQKTLDLNANANANSESNQNKHIIPPLGLVPLLHC